MSAGDSSIQYVKSEKIPGLSPFRSRSTIIALACLATLLAIATLTCVAAWMTGYFNNEIAALIFSNSVLILSKIVDSVFGHQAQTDKIKSDQGTTTVTAKTTV